ncbi:MAG: cupin domain-containing protein [Dehalococcoidia bacterium]
MSDRPDWIAALADASRGIDRGERIPFRYAYKHGSLEAGVYLPGERDNQQPHTRDEAYVVVAGSGTFVRGDERVTFGPGDFIFVPASVEHRFADYTPDLAVWVLFYGPEGGE